MCDTFIAMPDATLDGVLIFGKNSDRPAGEVQDVVALPARRHTAGDTLRCTHIQIPQVEKTFAVILSKPRWMWGAEMGANEHGVVAGNEAVWTTEPYARTGLLGMDLLRLGLERGATSRSALEVIVALLDEYGQGGNCAEYFAFSYHNSFMLADPREAWVLETAGSNWVAERITNGTRSISNSLSIRGPGDLRHPHLERVAKEPDGGDFDFAAAYSAGGVQETLSPLSREGRVRALCRESEGRFGVDTAQVILRDHVGGVCCHGEFETRGSQVSVLDGTGCKHWFIEGAFPCEQAFQLKRFQRGKH